MGSIIPDSLVCYTPAMTGILYLFACAAGIAWSVYCAWVIVADVAKLWHQATFKSRRNQLD